MRKRRSAVVSRGCLFALLFCVFASPLRANVRLAGVFGDHMVLQRDMRIAIWGSADPGETVVVNVAGQSVSVKAGNDGKWRVTLNPLKAAASPIEFTVAGKNKLVLQDVLAGDVWLCSGESNMVFPVGKDLSAVEELPKANRPGIRLSQVSEKAMREPLMDRALQWTACTPKTVNDFSGVGYFFGRDLQVAVNCPIGLIMCAASDTPAESWISLDALESDPELEPCLLAYQKTKGGPGNAGAPRAAKPGTPTSLFNGMVSPLTLFGLKGIVWYQGESNTDSAELYQNLFPALIKDWRKHWNRPNMPFLFVQLPGFDQYRPEPGPSKWAALREAQTLALQVPDTGMAVTLDLSKPQNSLHPPNKREIGRRLALIARRIAYGQNVDCYGPVCGAAKADGAKIRLTFNNAESGLVAGVQTPTDPNQPVAAQGLRLKGFSIAGADRTFVWADAVIDGDSVVVSSDKVESPAALRYGWDDNPEVNLYNRKGLPAVPFRTDDWFLDLFSSEPSAAVSEENAGEQEASEKEDADRETMPAPMALPRPSSGGAAVSFQEDRAVIVGAVDLIVRSLILAVVFLFMTYLSRGRIAIEGTAGYLVILFLFVPVNVFMNSGGRIPGIETLTAGQITIAIIVFNIVVGLIFSKILPGLTYSSHLALLIFLVLFSLVSSGLHYVPTIPTIGTGFD